MNDPFDRDRLSELVALLCDDLISDAQFEELDNLLAGSEEAREWYHVYMSINGDLDRQDHRALPIEAQLKKTTVVDKPTLPNVEASRGLKWPLVLAASLLFIVIGFAGFHYYNQSSPITNAGQLATISHVSDVTWGTGVKAINLNEVVTTGRIKFESGLLRLTYDHGVILSLMGPVDFDIRSAAHAVLLHGQLAAYVPVGAEGFRVDTPNAGLVDRGTEFGVAVNAAGETELSVFDGEVELTPTSKDAGRETIVVTSGQGMRVDSSGQAKPHQLAPFRDARDSLRGWRIVWEPFGPGSSTGKFPGKAGSGWTSGWDIQVENGKLNEAKTGVFDNQPLHPGAENYLTVGVRSSDKKACISTKVTRSFGSIDKFSAAKPYTVEMLVRTQQSNPRDLKVLRIFSKPMFKRDDSGSETWQLTAEPDADGLLNWNVSPRNDDKESPKHSLPVGSWESNRCFIEVNPLRKTWRATIANKQGVISYNSVDGKSLKGDPSEDILFGIEAIGVKGKHVQFSIDSIRIQNQPGR